MKKSLLMLCALAASMMLKAQNPYPILPIDSIQYVNPTKLATPTANTLPDYVDPVKMNPTYGDTVRFEGVVVSNPKIYGLSTSRKAVYVQRLGGGPWSGIQVMCDYKPTGEPQYAPDLATLIAGTKFYDVMEVGKLVRVTGVIRNFQGETQVNVLPSNNPNFSNELEFVDLLDTAPKPLVYTEITADQLMSGNPNTGWIQKKETAEQWEGTLVTIRNVSVYSIQQSGNRTFWSVIDDQGNVIDVRDFSAYYRRDDNEDTIPKIPNTFQPPPIGTRLDYIRGAITEYVVSSVSRYGISPLGPNDYKICTSCPPIIKYISRKPIQAKTTDSLTVTVEITVGDTALANSMFYYKKPGSTVIDSMAMTAVAGFPNYYAAKLAPVGVEGTFTFWVKGIDKKARSSFFPDPLTLGKSFYVTANGVNNIRTIQYSNVTSGATIWDGDTLFNIDVRGVVTGNNFKAGNTNLITVQDGTGPNSAIFIQRGVADTTGWQIGDSVIITQALVRESFNVTTLNNVTATFPSSGNPLPAFETGLSIDSFALGKLAYSRPYEGVLVKFENVVVANINPDAPTADNGEWSFAKDTLTAPALRVDDMSNTFFHFNLKLKKGMEMSFIQGPMYFSFANFKLIPRDFSDLDLSKFDTVFPVLTVLGENPDTFYVGSAPAYTDPGATAMDDKDGDITSRIQVSGTVSATVEGTYTLTYSVADAFGNQVSASRTVEVIDTTTTGLRNNELTSADIKVYPSPASDNITISIKDVKSMPVHVSIIDVLGREVASRTYNQKEVSDNINVSNYNSGVYFCVISNETGTRTIRFMVSGK